MNKVREPDLRGGQFIDKLQIWESDTATYSAATKEVLGNRILIKVLMKTLTPSLRAQVQFNLGATPTCASVRGSLSSSTIRPRDSVTQLDTFQVGKEKYPTHFQKLNILKLLYLILFSNGLLW